MTVRSSGPLGVLQLENTPSMFLGSLNNPDTFAFPIVCRKVPGAWVANIVPGDPGMQAEFIRVARDLSAEGARAITTNCGFTLRYQRALAASLDIPVSTSSLLLLPYLAAITLGRIGVLTFDSGPLTPDLLRLSGLPDTSRVAIAGLEDTPSWAAMLRAENDFTLDDLERDLGERIDAMRQDHPDISVLLFECAAFGSVSAGLRRRSGLPIYDAVVNANLLMSGTVSGEVDFAAVDRRGCAAASG